MTEMLVRGVTWGKWAGEAPPWLNAGEAPARCLFDLKTPSNNLSVYRVPEGAPLERAVIALAGTKQQFEEAGYIAFDPSIVQDLEIAIDDKPIGQTPDAVVDEWHEHLVQLSATGLAQLATRLWRLQLQDDPRVVLDRLHEPVVTERLVEGVKKGELRIARMLPDLRLEVQKRIAEEA